MLYVSVPKLSQNEVLVPVSMALCFDIDVSGRNAKHFLAQNGTWALVDKLVVKFAGIIMQDTIGYDIY